MIAEIVSTGTEICQGKYADTNAQHLSRELTLLGVKVNWHTATLDEADLLRDVLGRATRRADLVIMTGGLGPTEDDMTRGILAHLCGTELFEDSKVLDMIVARFRRRGFVMTPSNRSQAMVPRGSTVLYNDWGTAPGVMIEVPRAGKAPSVLIALPGPPREMRPMFEQRARPLLRERLGLRPHIRILDIHTCFRAESQLNEVLRDLFGSDPRVTLAWLASIGQVDIRLTSQAESDGDRDEALEAFRRKVVERIGEEDVYGYDEDTLESVVGRLLLKKGQTIALAESCTVGLAAKRLTDISGSSGYFVEGFVTYSNEAKIKRLGVDPTLIERHGAVSEPVARAMAEGVRRVSGATLGGAITGIAGPTGGTAEKPVGMVCVALATPTQTLVNTSTYSGDRDLVRNQSVNRVLDMARRYLKSDQKNA
jgi:nicotinamide-nucleotide amidase